MSPFKKKMFYFYPISVDLDETNKKSGKLLNSYSIVQQIIYDFNLVVDLRNCVSCGRTSWILLSFFKRIKLIFFRNCVTPSTLFAKRTWNPTLFDDDFKNSPHMLHTQTCILLKLKWLAAAIDYICTSNEKTCQKLSFLSAFCRCGYMKIPRNCFTFHDVNVLFSLATSTLQ